MKSYRHITAPLRVFQGAESINALGAELARLKSQRAVIFCGSTLSKDKSVMDLITSAMGDRCAGV